MIARFCLATFVLILGGLAGCAGMKERAIYHGATSESWRCPRDNTVIQNWGHDRYRFLGCGWVQDYECETYSMATANGGIMSSTNCERVAPPVPLVYAPPPATYAPPMNAAPAAAASDAGVTPDH